MRDLQLKYIEIIFNKEKPQPVGTEINILGKIDNINGEVEYKFIVGKGGIWTAIQEFSENNQCVWKPEKEGNYIVMVQAREKGKSRPLDYLAKEDYSIVAREVRDSMKKENVIDEFSQCDNVNLESNKDVIVNKEFKNFINGSDDNDLKLKEVQITEDEKKILLEEMETGMNEEVAVTKEITELKDENLKNLNANEKEANGIISEVSLNANELIVGEKFSIKVKTIDNKPYLFRFYVKKNKEWTIIRDYDVDDTLIYTINEPGKREFLIQCKEINSIEVFDDFKIVNVNVKDIGQINIVNIECLSKEIIVGEKLNFRVETEVDGKSDNDAVLLYKFYKISKDGRSSCIQDYSTKNEVSYVEELKGNYRILCLVKNILSNREYDDRAIFVYNVKPYRKIKINSFVADINSPQATETDIEFTSEIEGGNSILYRYKVKGPIEQDTGFINSKAFNWNPSEPGEYEILLFVKDASSTEEYEDYKKIAFTIEKRGKKPIKILDVVVDKEKKVIINEPVNIMVSAEGGTGLLYSFIIRKDQKTVKTSKYTMSNWIDFTPEEIGEYEVEIRVKDKYSKKDYDINALIYVRALEYIPGEVDYIILPYKETHLIGDIIELECIVQNTQEVLLKYETKINGNTIEQTEFSKNKKLRFIPKISGKYTIEVYAKSIKCKNEYDTRKQINLYVSEAAPVINTKIESNRKVGRVNEEFSIEVTSRGGKDICYEFYLMENGNWKKVQSYSKKNFYSFIPFKSGQYKILALAKSYYKKLNYEDYDQLTFEVKDLEE